jgi:hypothetical protein
VRRWPACTESTTGVAQTCGPFAGTLASALREVAPDIRVVLTSRPGSEVVFATVEQCARPAGSSAHMHVREAWALVCAEGAIVWGTAYPDVDEGRTAAERLAHERA